MMPELSDRKRRVDVVVNGVRRSAEADPRMLLVDFIREELALTGTHVGCEQGACGACTVVLDGQIVRSCILFAVQADGCEIETVEGMADGDRLTPLQEAFREHHGLQCGFCTPGMLLTARSLLQTVEDPTDEEIRTYMAGNICRCTGYVGIIAAIRDAAKRTTPVGSATPPTTEGSA